jgi:hypothetical protein
MWRCYAFISMHVRMSRIHNHACMRVSWYACIHPINPSMLETQTIMFMNPSMHVQMLHIHIHACMRICRYVGMHACIDTCHRERPSKPQYFRNTDNHGHKSEHMHVRMLRIHKHACMWVCRHACIHIHKCHTSILSNRVHESEHACTDATHS